MSEDTTNIAVENITARDIVNEWIVLGLLKLSSFRFKRIDSRRLWPLLTILIIAAVTITHEATFAGSFEEPGFEFIGWPYAIAINMAIIISEYFMGWKTSRRAAWVTFIVATFGSGALNVAYVKPWEASNWWDAIFAFIYALLPTILIIFLGLLSSKVGKLASSREASWAREEEKEKDDRQKAYQCFCGEGFEQPIQLAGHTRKHIAELRKGQVTALPQAIALWQGIYPEASEFPDAEKINGWIESYSKNE